MAETPVPSARYKALGSLIHGLLERLEDHNRILSQLKSAHCNPKTVYWELPAFVAPLLGQLAMELKAATEELGGWLFVEELARAIASEKNVVGNLIRLASLLQAFGCRLAEGKVICTDASRLELIDHLRASGQVPGPLSHLEASSRAFFGRQVDEKTLASLIGQTLSPGVVAEVDRKPVVFSLDRPPSCRDLLLGCLRLWKGPLSLRELLTRLKRLEAFQATALELEMEVHGLKAEGKVGEREGLFFLEDSHPDPSDPQSPAEVADLVFQTLFEIATADGVVRPEEMTLIGNLLAVEFELPADVREPFETLLGMAVHRSLNHRQLGQSLSAKKLASFSQELRDHVFRGAVAVAFVDLEIHEHERQALEVVAKRLRTSLPAPAVVERFGEMCRPPYVDYAYFGILPDRYDPDRLHHKLLILQNHYLEKLAGDNRPPAQEVERLQALLAEFYRGMPSLPAPWLVGLDLKNPVLPLHSLRPLHCFLRVARSDGPLNSVESQTIARLVRGSLHDLQDRALWNLQTRPLAELHIPAPEPEEPDLRTLSFSLVVALCDGPLNVEKSRELLSLASDLGVSERSFQVLHQLEQAARRHLQEDPGLEQLQRLELALEAAERLPRDSAPPSAVATPLVLPDLQPGGHPYLVVIRPSGRHNFIVHLRVRSELNDVPFLQEQLNAAIEARPWLRDQCAGRSWFLCKGVSNCLRLLQEVKESPFEVQWPHGQPFQVLGKAGLHNLRATIGQKQGWFEIGGKLQLGQGHQIGLLDLLDRVRQNPEAIAVAPDTFVQLDDALRSQLEKLNSLLPEGLHASTIDPLRARLVAGQVHFFEDQTNNHEFSRLAALIEEAGELKPDLPAELWERLRDYQKEGVEWMLRTLHAGLGACLADDMGLGKTLQTLCVLYHRRAQGPSLVVAPTSVTYNWKEQAQRFLPDLRVLLYEGPGPVRHLAAEKLDEYEVVVVSYGIFHKDHALLGARDWNCLVLDEAQKIKNPSSATARSAFDMKARARLATTGTPIENHLVELWSLMNFLNPGLLGTQNHFRQTYLTRGDDAAESDRLSRLRSQVGHFILRRRKQMVAPQLPAKLETVHRIDLSSEEREFYNQIRRGALQMQKEDRISLLTALTRLRQACCDPALVDEQWTSPSSKISAAVEILAEVSAEGHQILVFSQFVSLLNRLARHLDEEGLPYRSLYGSTPVEERRALVDDFQQGKFRIFLISLKAGGTGLTLTRADYVLHLDPWWNPAVEDQATDRAHRIGQTQTVNVYRLIARETVEEKVLELHQSKRELAESVLAQDGSPSLLSVEDLKALL
ncbi:MAG: TerB family tellurite resistance protein [Candidatus Eremiobacteraeota bacterium]|nr:TerB family tellurite resistance protein [Candidatus Eremiobacteraeota bacterium]